MERAFGSNSKGRGSLSGARFVDFGASSAPPGRVVAKPSLTKNGATSGSAVNRQQPDAGLIFADRPTSLLRDMHLTRESRSRS